MKSSQPPRFAVALILALAFASAGCLRTPMPNQSFNHNKTYVDPDYHFEVQYPDTAQVEARNNPEGLPLTKRLIKFVWTIQAPVDPRRYDIPRDLLTISVDANPTQLSPEDFVRAHYEYWLGTPKTLSDFFLLHSSTLAGLPALEFGTERDLEVLVSRGDAAIEFAPLGSPLLQTVRFTH